MLTPGGPGRRTFVAWLVDPEFAAAGQRQPREQAPPLVLHRRALHRVRLQLADQGLDIVAQKIKLADIVPLGGVDSRWAE